MRGKAHAVIGLAAAAPIAAVSPATGLIALAMGVLGGLVPDADHPDSVIGRCIPWPAVREGRRTGRWRPGGVIWHRGEVHSVGCAVLTSLLAALVRRDPHEDGLDHRRSLRRISARIPQPPGGPPHESLGSDAFLAGLPPVLATSVAASRQG